MKSVMWVRRAFLYFRNVPGEVSVDRIISPSVRWKCAARPPIHVLQHGVQPGQAAAHLLRVMRTRRRGQRPQVFEDVGEHQPRRSSEEGARSRCRVGKLPLTRRGAITDGSPKTFGSQLAPRDASANNSSHSATTVSLVGPHRALSADPARAARLPNE